MKDRTGRRARGIPTAIVLIVVGIFLLVSKQDWIAAEVLQRWWPALLILAGVLILALRGRDND